MRRPTSTNDLCAICNVGDFRCKAGLFVFLLPIVGFVITFWVAEITVKVSTDHYSAVEAANGLN